ncbi:MAG: agmatine deiminase family protein [Oceanococcus sp.]
MQPRLPAEWEPQYAVMLTWPRPDGAFTTDTAAWQATRLCFESILSTIARFQRVIVSACAGDEYQRLAQWLAKQSFAYPVQLFAANSNDVWARDHGPIGVYAGPQVQLLDFRFDGWGGKYPAQHDNILSLSLHAQGAFDPRPIKTVDLTLEGGAIEGNGAGYLLATRSSVLCEKRNPSVNSEAIENRLKLHLGVQHILWLDHGHLAGDDTDGHIDTLARFANTNTLVYQASGDERDINRDALLAMAAELATLRDQNQQPFRLLPLPWPGLHHDSDGQTLPASYANFLIINNAVLMPCYGVEQDAQAIAILQQEFPDRTVIGIDCQALIRQYGSLHCVTMNIPA